MLMEKAKEIASNLLGSSNQSEDFKYIILNEYTIERRDCFVFFYESSRYLETKQFEDRLAGNSPILVEKNTGIAHWLGTAEPVDYYIAKFESGVPLE